MPYRRRTALPWRRWSRFWHRGQAISTPATIEPPPGLDLIDYARQNRLRTRNLHDGGSVPPARKSGKSAKTGYVGDEDRFDAIVGHRGFLTAEGGGLGICLLFKSGRGVESAREEITALGGRVNQVGDTELGGWLPLSALEPALKLIRVSKLRPGNDNLTRYGTGCGVQNELDGHDRAAGNGIQELAVCPALGGLSLGRPLNRDEDRLVVRVNGGGATEGTEHGEGRSET